MGFLTIEEVAQLLKVEAADILSLIEDGKIRAVRIREHLRIRDSELEELEARCPAAD
jgi:excisionase family DNA binding protein